ncbi:DUF5686 and carboxypeptidase regulatory-like domain-containing protein [Flavobacterium sp. JP2137]|uniref:DUF5686 and carboxypeptidase regulatory-like domain-containing protein n=1 Tax=Flavobacterium sp. JP2137 TaxID=3414510 RepID=UPI003D2FDD22
MKFTITLLLSLFGLLSFAQIKGKITDEKGQPIVYASITIENTSRGTSSNEKGEYELYPKKEGETLYLNFQYLGYKTQRMPMAVKAGVMVLNITMVEEEFMMNDIVIKVGENIADGIMRNAIKSKKANSKNTSKFTVDFYSKGNLKILKLPKLVGVSMGNQEISKVDSLNPSVIYLSETVSKIAYQKPDKIKERIVASKISGNDSGYSFNTARESFYDFYDEAINLNKSIDVKMVSPLANNAFNYYKFQLEGTFMDGKHLINKIRVIPKRDKEPVFEGAIYIVEDSWAIYGIEFDVLGYRMQEPLIDKLALVQNYSYQAPLNAWIKTVQSIDFTGGMLGVKLQAKFSYVFSNYEFVDHFEAKTFTEEMITYDAASNKVAAEYWQEHRQIPLTEEEVKDYHVKDSVQLLKNSAVYIDSLDRSSNRFGLGKLLSGYTYTNTPKSYTLQYGGLVEIGEAGFNTVQGWQFGNSLRFKKTNKEKGSTTAVAAVFNYGFAEDRLRVVGAIAHQFNAIDRKKISLTGGSSAEQFNASPPISKWVNTASSLLFKDNYMKLYNKEFVKAEYSQEVYNGIFIDAGLEYAKRKPLYNNTDYVIFNRSADYTSNNPLDPTDYSYAGFDTHRLFKATVGGAFNFGQRYISQPHQRINIPSNRYPVLSLKYEKAFGATESGYQYDLVTAQLAQEIAVNNKGDFSYQVKAGKFFGADDIAFMDYYHFNGNQTHLNLGGNRLSTFNIMPYYEWSTNKEFVELHLEHNFKGYIMNKIPLLDLLQWNLVLGYHNAITTDRKPYQEFTAGFSNIGIGKFRGLRLDYVRSLQHGISKEGIMVGVTLFNR